MKRVQNVRSIINALVARGNKWKLVANHEFI